MCTELGFIFFKLPILSMVKYGITPQTGLIDDLITSSSYLLLSCRTCNTDIRKLYDFIPFSSSKEMDFH